MRSTLCLLVIVPIVLAQTEETAVEWQKHNAKISYGVVQVGRHKIDELQTGGAWRMGRNDASTLATDMALLVGDQVVVPGTYRVQIYRQGGEDFALSIDGGSLGEAPQAAPASVYAKGALGKPEKPSKVLEVLFKPDGKAKDTVQPAKVTVTYGENQLVAPLNLVGTKSQKSQGWTLDVFSLPAETVEKRLGENKATPFAALKKESGKKNSPFHIWNLVVTKDSAEFWPAPKAPTGQSSAFAGIDGLSAANMSKATSVKWEEGKDNKAFLDLGKFEVAKGKGMTITLLVGKQTVTLAIPEPKTPE
jgi:hypothetical protein